MTRIVSGDEFGKRCAAGRVVSGAVEVDFDWYGEG